MWKLDRSLILVLLVAASVEAAEPVKTELNFSFGPGVAPAGFVRVAADATYSQETGSGFEPGAKIMAVDREKGAGFCTSDAPFFFSAKVSEGNYKVTVALGDTKAESTTTVKAELRRLMLEQVHAAAGEQVSRSFIVNVRRPEYPGGKVKLKAPRETMDEAWAWDEKLTLEFNGAHVALCSIAIAKVEVPTIYILGDSTVCDQSKEPYASWGQMLPRFFKPEIAVANHAESGETLGSSQGAHRFDKVLSLIKPGDYLLLQFGHNDMKTKEANGPQMYKERLKKWAEQVKAKGATPVLITPMNRHSFEGKVVTNSLKEYPAMVREAAAEMKVSAIDLNAMSKTLYEALGPEPSIGLFKHDADLSKYDGTHHSPYGAYELAKCVINGLKRAEPELEKFVVEDMAGFDPAKPDAVEKFLVPASPGKLGARPLGD